MTTALQLPVLARPGTSESRRRFRKQVLPIGTVPYSGRTLRFDLPVLRQLATNFARRAMNQVPFVVADDQNRHTAAPEAFRGEVVALTVQPDGLEATLELTAAGAELVASNPALGVSARIAQDHPFGLVLEHVCGTLRPRAEGMRPWEPIDLSASIEQQLIDLTEASWTEIVDELREERAVEEAARRWVSTGDARRPIDLSNQPRNEAQRLAALMEAYS